MRYSVVVTISLVVFLCIAAPQQVRAERATQEEMEFVCQNWLLYIVHERGAWAGDPHPEIVDVRKIAEGDIILGSYFSVSPHGFVIVPVLKELPPIKAYSEECQLNVDQEIGLPQLLREILNHRIGVYIRKYGSLDAVQPPLGDVLFGREHREQWNRFLKSKQSFEADLREGEFPPLTEVGPLLTTSWHQSSPYNDFCPMGDGARCVAGCVAAAAAQIMKYWNWPPHGSGSRSYTWDGDQSCGGDVGGGLLSATFSDDYDWQHMPDSCDFGCAPQDSAALAELCYEVGVAFQMDYGACGSGTWTYMALTVFPTYFRYDSSIDKEDRDDHAATEWFSIIQTEIDNGRPIQYRIHRHSIVCDGWRDTGGQDQYHINYGWGGSHTAWYTIDNIYCPWPGCDPMVEYIIRNIMPEFPTFIRADADGDSIITMSDAIYTLKHLYVPGSDPPTCMKTADSDDDGEVVMSDAIYTLKYLYVPGSPQPPSPFPDCGVDPTADELSCDEHPCMHGGQAVRKKMGSVR